MTLREIYILSTKLKFLQNERISFFQGIITRSAKSPKDYTRRQDIESEKAQVNLPKAPPLPTRQLTEIEKQKLKKHDIHVLREFRRELRCIIEDMLKSKRYKHFAHPVVIITANTFWSPLSHTSNAVFTGR